MWWIPLAHAIDTPTRVVLPDQLYGFVWDIRQDERGWLWVGTASGLYGYDGETVERFGPKEFQEEVRKVVQPPRAGRALVETRLGAIVELTRTRAHVLPAAGREGFSSALLDGQGRLWGGTGEGLWRWELDHWERRDAEPVWTLMSAGGALYAGSADQLRELDGDGDTVARWEMEDPVAIETDGETRWVLGGWANLYRLDPELEHVDYTFARGRALLYKDGEVWAAYNRWMERLEAGAYRQPRLSWVDELDPIAVVLDEEGSLWLGGGAGLRQVPSPRTARWILRDGLPDLASYNSILASGRLWLMTWQGAAAMDPAGVRPPLSGFWAGRPCVVGDETWAVWWQPTQGLNGLLRLDDPMPDPVLTGDHVQACAAALQDPGAVWAVTGRELLLVDGDAVVGRWPVPGRSLDVLETEDGWLWIYPEGQGCRARLPVGDRLTWTCEPLPERQEITDSVEVDGELWAGGETGSVIRWDGQDWRIVPSSLDRESRHVTEFSPSPRGGVWVSSHTTPPVRVRPTGDGDWELLERLDGWSGLVGGEIPTLQEDADGSIWAGLTHIDASARQLPRPPRAPELASLSIDGGDGPIRWRSSVVEARFRVASYRERSRIRWRYRLSAAEPWSPPTRSSTFYLAAPAAGDWALEAQASLDGERWSDTSAAVPLQVLLPWYLRPAAVSAWLGLTAGAAYGVHRLRLAAARRVERERTRIAMDLHDEIGSSIGAIAVLTDLAAQDELGETERRELAERAADAARSTGDALSGIVWALREGAGSPEALAQAIVDRAERIFPGGSPEVAYDIASEWPARRMSVEEFRNVLLVTVEAMQNARRHAQARRVWVRLHPWFVVVEDDGVGLGGSSAVGTGTGMASMQARALAVGGRLAVGPREGGGTKVELRFSLRPGSP